MKINKRSHYFDKSALLIALVITVISFNGYAAPGTPEQSPLFIGNAVKPNILLAIDESGSMDWEVVFNTAESILWWDAANARYDDGAGALNINIGNNDTTTWRRYGYLFPNGDNSTYNGQRLYNDDDTCDLCFPVRAIPPTINYAFTRSSFYNKAYYDPAVKYDPWISYGTTVGTDKFDTSLSDISATGARYDPMISTYKLNLFGTVSDTDSEAAQRTFRMYKGMTIPKDTRYKILFSSTPGTMSTTAWIPNAASDLKIHSTGASTDYVDVAIPYYPAIYYVKVTSGTYQVDSDGNGSKDINGNCSSPLPAHYAFFHNYPFTFTGSSSDVNALAPDGACLKTVTIASSNAPFTHGGANRTDCATPTSCTYTEEQQNFANWFTYYRKRHLAMRGSVAAAFNEMTGIRVKPYGINQTSTNLTMLDIDTQLNTFLANIYALHAESQGTPNRTALKFAGDQFMRTTGGPITNECQKNFALLFTDGYSNVENLSGIANDDSGDGAPYQDTYSDTIADVARYYYETNLRSDLSPTGKVPAPNTCPNPLLDCNTNLHMNTYGIVLNATGKTYWGKTVGAITYNSVTDAYTTPTPTWEEPSTERNPVQVDDLYHACVNGHGEMFTANSPADIKTQMEAALVAITNDIGSSSAIAVNTTELSLTTAVYQARFNSEYWSGQLFSKSINPNTGVVNTTPTWDAGTVLPTAANRNIITFNPTAAHANGTGLGVAFTSVASLSTAAINDLGTALPTGTVCGGVACTSTHLLNYLRGDRTHESKTVFRVRDPNTVLGDIVHSAPVSVNNQDLKWPDGTLGFGYPSGVDPSTGSYAAFVAAQSSRPNMIYFGANDGMLHGVLGDDGVEKIAYIPNSLFSTGANAGLHYLSEQSYPHRYYVDNEPTASDVYIKSRLSTGAIDSTLKWRTVLLGSLNSGGRGLFALDITTPADFIAANAAKLALWEFDNNPNGTGTGDVDLGLTYSKPEIVPTNAVDANGNIRWATIVGNGYNSGIDGGTGDCEAHLFILFMDGGLDGVWTNDTTDTNYDTTDYIKLETKTGGAGTCNGLSSVRTVDLNGDHKVDRVYAGDVLGNMWSFDLCNDTDSTDSTYTCQAAGWKVAYGTVANPAPLFTAKDASNNPQSITVRPRVVVNPDITTIGSNLPNYLILFGTGQYITAGDKTDITTTNSIYGVWDDNDTTNPVTIPYTRSNLVEQTITTYDLLDASGNAGTDGYNETRVSSNNAVNYAGNGNAKDAGWYRDLPDVGTGGSKEKIFVEPIIVGDQVKFISNVITSNACDIGGYHYNITANINNGGPSTEPTFDANNDGVINSLDLVDTDGDGVGDTAASDQGGSGGQGDDLGFGPKKIGNYLCITTSTGDVICEEITVPGVGNLGRQSWQELRND